MQVFDVYFGNQQFVQTAIAGSYSPHEKVPPGTYSILRFTIGTDIGFACAPTSLSLIKVVVSQPTSAMEFFNCTLDSSLGKQFGITVDYLTPESLTHDQRKQAINLLSGFDDFWWKNASAQVKKLLGGEVSPEDEAVDICRMAASAYVENNLPKAKELFNKAISKFHRIGGARHELGRIAIDEGDLRTALRMFYDELEYAKNPSKDTALLYLYEINTAIGDKPEFFLNLAEVFEVKKRIFLPSDEINKIRIAANKFRAKRGW